MCLNPITGLNILNNILKVIKVKIPIDAPGIKHMTKMILTRELNMYFSKLRKEDEKMSFEALDKFTDQELNMMCLRRGIAFEDKSKEQKLKDLKLWMAISNLRNVPHTLLLFSRITEHTDEMF